MTSGIRLQQAGQLKKLHTRQELSEEESLRLRKQVELIKSYIPIKNTSTTLTSSRIRL